MTDIAFDIVRFRTLAERARLKIFVHKRVLAPETGHRGRVYGVDSERLPRTPFIPFSRSSTIDTTSRKGSYFQYRAVRVID